MSIKETCHVVNHIRVGRIIGRVGVALNASVEDGWMLHLFSEELVYRRLIPTALWIDVVDAVLSL